MTFPTVGIIAIHQVRGIYEFEALKLGIKVNFISEKCSVEELIEFSQGCDLINVDPKIISPASIKTVEKAFSSKGFKAPRFFTSLPSQGAELLSRR